MFAEVHNYSVWRRDDGAAREVHATCWWMRGGRTGREVFTRAPLPSDAPSYQRSGDYAKCTLEKFLATHTRLGPEESRHARDDGAQLRLPFI